MGAFAEFERAYRHIAPDGVLREDGGKLLKKTLTRVIVRFVRRPPSNAKTLYLLFGMPFSYRDRQNPTKDPGGLLGFGLSAIQIRHSFSKK